MRLQIDLQHKQAAQGTPRAPPMATISVHTATVTHTRAPFVDGSHTHTAPQPAEHGEPAFNPTRGTRGRPAEAAAAHLVPGPRPGPRPGHSAGRRAAAGAASNSGGHSLPDKKSPQKRTQIKHGGPHPSQLAVRIMGLHRAENVFTVCVDAEPARDRV